MKKQMRTEQSQGPPWYGVSLELMILFGARVAEVVTLSHWGGGHIRGHHELRLDRAPIPRPIIP